MHITVSNKWISFRGFPEKEISQLKALFSYRVKGCEYMARFKNGTWDGKKSLVMKSYIATSSHYAPVGIIRRIWNKYKNDDRVSFDNKVVSPTPLDETYRFVVDDFELRENQKVQDLARLKKRGLFDMAVNSGKTVVACGIIAEFNVTTMYLVHTGSLFKQITESIQKFFPDEDVGQIGLGKFKITDRINVCMVQTLDSKLKSKDESIMTLFKSTGLLIGDEAHHFSSDQFYRVAMSVNSLYRFGLSGTMPRDIKLVGIFGDIIHKVENKEMISKGHSKKVKCLFYKVGGQYTRYDHEQCFADNKGADLFKRANRNGIAINQIKKRLKKDLTVLVLVERIEHGELIHSKIKGSEFYWRATPKEDKVKILNNFKEGKLKCIVGIDKIFKEGISIDSIDVIVNLVGGTKVVQTVGRVLRLGGSRTYKEYLDFYDTYNNVFKKHSAYRISDLRSIGMKAELINDEVNQ